MSKILSQQQQQQQQQKRMIIIKWREIKEKITQQQQKCMLIAFELNPHLERHLEKKRRNF